MSGTGATGGRGVLGRDFFDRPVREVARELVGCTLNFDGVGGVIVETEAYDATDPACHAYNGPTARNEPLYGPPGMAYVYFSYGVHYLLNAVCEPEGSAAAVLIRALEPAEGVEAMHERRGREALPELCSGPGKLTQALGIGPEQNEADLCRTPFELSARRGDWTSVEVDADMRIGISKGAELPWRYCARGSGFLSRPVSAAAETRARAA